MSEVGNSVPDGATVVVKLSPCANCGEETSQCCRNCRKEFFCSDICQEARQKQHKLICFPAKKEIGVALRTRPGENKPKRFWAATRDIKEGETIFTDHPLLTGPGEKEPVPGRHICIGCHKILEKFDVETDARKCGDCGWPLCGDACPGIDCHLKECEILCRMRLYKPKTRFEDLVTLTGVDAVYGIIRVVRVMDLVKEDVIKLQSFLNLNVPDHVHPIPNNAKAAMRIFKSGGQVGQLSEDTILTLISVAINRHSSPYYPTKNKAELLIYEKETRMDVSCMGNCYVTRIPILNEMKDPHGIAIVAAQPIQEGERLSITSGGNPKWDGTKRRRETQMKNKVGNVGFVCKCTRCSDPTELGTNVSAIKCTECKSGLLLPLDPLDDNSKWECNKSGCERIFPAFCVDRVVKNAQIEADAIKLAPLSVNPFAIDLALLDGVTKFVEKYEKILNPHHYILLNVQELTLRTSNFLNRKTVRPDKPFSSDLSQKINEHRRIAEMFLDLASKIFPPISNPLLKAHFYVGMSKFFSAQQSVRNKKKPADVQDLLKQGILHRRHVKKIEIKMSLTLPSEDNAECQTLMTYLGEALENALELCRLTTNYSRIRDNIIEFDQNLCAAEVPTMGTSTVEEN